MADDFDETIAIVQGRVFEDERFSRTKVRIIEYLIDAEKKGTAPVATPKIERGIKERQPTVSKAIKDLREAGYIITIQAKESRTRGSPPHLHRLSGAWRDVTERRIQNRIYDLEEEIKTLRHALRKLDGKVEP